MTGVVWDRAKAVPWLVTRSPEGHAPMAGITFGIGWMGQPVTQLGVAGLLGEWLKHRLTRPVEERGPGRGGTGVEVAFSLGQTDSSLLIEGEPAELSHALRRVDELLATVDTMELTEELRDRARAYVNPIRPWRHHLAARWPGFPPHLGALGPLALDTVDAADVAAFVEGQVRTARRVIWTNEPSLTQPVPAPVAMPQAPLEPSGWRHGPACVVARSPAERFTLAMPDRPAVHIGLSVLLAGLVRRLVTFEPLAADVSMTWYAVGDGMMLVCCAADVLAGKESAAQTAVLQTLEDLAGGSVGRDQIARVRSGHVHACETAPWHEPGQLLRLVRRQLVRADLPTPAMLAQEFALVSDDEVRAALADGYRQLLLAVPAPGPGEPTPFPMAERLAPRPANGRTYPRRLPAFASVRCSPERVGLVQRRLSLREPTQTLASVDFDEVVVRLDDGEYRTTLVDQQFSSVEVVYDVYRHAGRLRALIRGSTGGVPVLHRRANEQEAARLARALRNNRLATVIPAMVLAVLLGVSFGVAALTGGFSGPAMIHVQGAGTARLPNGTTLTVTAGPEVIEHYNVALTDVYAAQLRMCAGAEDGKGRDFFGAERFQLQLGEERVTAEYGPPGIVERPIPPRESLDAGTCVTGWLLFRLPAPLPHLPPPVLAFTTTNKDRVTWRLPAAADSPLSRPCPEQTVPAPRRTSFPYMVPGEPPLAGCPPR